MCAAEEGTRPGRIRHVEKARREVGTKSAGIRESRGRKSEQMLRQSLVSLQRQVEVALVDSESDSHVQKLRAFDDSAVAS